MGDWEKMYLVKCNNIPKNQYPPGVAVNISCFKLSRAAAYELFVIVLGHLLDVAS